MGDRFGIDHISKLTGGNWKCWKFQITLVLKVKRLWKIVTGEEARPSTGEAEEAEWKVKDAEARCVIFFSLDKVQSNRVLGTKTAKEMFDRLREDNVDSSSFNKLHLMKKLLNYTIHKNQSPIEAMNEIEMLHFDLKEIGGELSEEILMEKIVSSLPKKYSAFQTAWDFVPDEGKTLKFLKSRLRLAESRQKFSAENEKREQEAAQSSKPRNFRVNQQQCKNERGNRQQQESNTEVCRAY